MTNYVEKIVDITTNTEIIRQYTADEIAESKAEEARLTAEQAKRDAEQAVKGAARQVVLDKLGLTADEMAALLS